MPPTTNRKVYEKENIELINVFGSLIPGLAWPCRILTLHAQQGVDAESDNDPNLNLPRVLSELAIPPTVTQRRMP